MVVVNFSLLSLFSRAKALNEALVKKARETRVKKARKAVNGDARVLTVDEILKRQQEKNQVLEEQQQARARRDEVRTAAAEWRLVREEVFPRDIRVFR